MQSNIHLDKRLILITRNKYLKLMILVLFFNAQEESGVIEILPEIIYPSRDPFVESTECFIEPAGLKKSLNYV